jgi:hypothetical protein
LGLIATLLESNKEFFQVGTCLGCLILLIGGVIFSTSDKVEYQTTCSKEEIPLFVNLSKDGLDVVIRDYTHHKFTSWEDVNLWKNGGKFYMKYEFAKDEFGLDKERKTLVIK